MTRAKFYFVTSLLPLLWTLKACLNCEILPQLGRRTCKLKGL